MTHFEEGQGGNSCSRRATIARPVTIQANRDLQGEHLSEVLHSISPEGVNSKRNQLQEVILLNQQALEIMRHLGE
eukprot:12892956-Prorocentrum_lima.AAC.1